MILQIILNIPGLCFVCRLLYQYIARWKSKHALESDESINNVNSSTKSMLKNTIFQIMIPMLSALTDENRRYEQWESMINKNEQTEMKTIYIYEMINTNVLSI